jgi:putative ABC transport system permease protein
MIRDSLRIALHVLRQYPLRTAFIIVTNMTAVLALIVLVVVMQSLQAKVRELFSSQGADMLYLTRRPPILRVTDLRKYENYPSISMAEVEFLRRQLRLAEAVVPAAYDSADVTFQGRSVRAAVQARSADYLAVENLPLYLGRHFTPDEDAHRRRVAVLGWGVYRELFRGQDPLRRWVWIGGQAYRVVGVVQERGTLLGNDMDTVVWVPLRAWRGARPDVDYVILRPRSGREDDLMEEVRFWLRLKRRLRPFQEDNFGLMTTEGFLDILRNATQALSLALVGIVSLGVLVGGIVLMNILLMAVAERTQEIGIRKAVGAHPSAIAAQFLWEAIVLASLGGFAGVAVGLGISYLVSRLLSLPWTFPFWVAGLGLGLTGLSGVLFGYYPARRAARLDPVQALHYEHG